MKISLNSASVWMRPSNCSRSSIFALRPTLLTLTVIIAAGAFMVGRRLGPLYLNLVERELVKYQDAPQFSLVSDAGWTVLQLPSAAPSSISVPALPALSPPPAVDPWMAMLGDLRSRDAAVVTAALERANLAPPQATPSSTRR